MLLHIPIINRNFHDINPLLVGTEICEKSHSFGPASRDYFLIHYIVSGTGIFEKGDKKIKLSTGWMFLIRPEEITLYTADANDPWTYIWIGFDGDYSKKFMNETKSFNNSVMYFPDAEAIFKSMLEANSILDCAEIFLCGKIFELFSKLYIKSELAKAQPQTSTYTNRAINFILSNYMDDVSVDKLSKMLGIDRRYLCRIFKQATGKSPQQFLIDARLEKAAQILNNTNYPINEISTSVGYGDIYNFSKMFKRKFGVSPNGYRKGIK